MEWLLLVYWLIWLIGVMLTVRLIGNIAPLHPPWMQRDPAFATVVIPDTRPDVADPRRSRALRRIG